MAFLIASITPVIIFLYLIYRKDSVKEPLGQLAKCFFGGFLAIGLTLGIDAFLTGYGETLQEPLTRSFYDAFVTAAIPEEFSKFLILYWLIWSSKHFDQYYDGILYAVFVGLGFALVENIFYVMEGGLGVALVRGVLSVPGHGFFAVLMGYYLSLARFHTAGSRVLYLIQGLAMPMFFHGMYDFGLMYGAHDKADPLLAITLMVIFTIVVIFLWKIGFERIKEHLQADRQQDFIP